MKNMMTNIKAPQDEPDFCIKCRIIDGKVVGKTSVNFKTEKKKKMYRKINEMLSGKENYYESN